MKYAPTLRETAIRDLLAEIEEWKRASGPDRAYYRRLALFDLAEFRRKYTLPERERFAAAVARSKAAETERQWRGRTVPVIREWA